MTLRSFEDLIKPIEIDGETFVPIEEIAKLGMSKIDNNIPEISEKGISIFGTAQCKVNIKIYDYQIKYYFGINDSFDTFCSNDSEVITVDNQVQIVKNLIKWGFIEP